MRNGGIILQAFAPFFSRSLLTHSAEVAVSLKSSLQMNISSGNFGRGREEGGTGGIEESCNAEIKQFWTRLIATWKWTFKRIYPIYVLQQRRHRVKVCSFCSMFENIYKLITNIKKGKMTILGDNLIVSRMRLSTKAIQVTQTLPRHLPTVILSLLLPFVSLAMIRNMWKSIKC